MSRNRLVNDNMLINNNSEVIKSSDDHINIISNGTTVLMDNNNVSAPTAASHSSIKTNRSHLKRRNSIDKQTLTLNIEQELSYRLYILFELNFIINLQELRCIIKLYLDRRGIRIKHFLANMPTYDYIENFLQRNIIIKEKLMNRKNVNDKVLLPLVATLISNSKFIEKTNNKSIDESVLLDSVIVDVLKAKYNKAIQKK